MRLPGRWTLVVLGVVGCAISLYLAAFQLQLTAAVWDPIFGTGSERVLTSSVSRMLPVPDALLGAAAYAVDAALATLLAVRIGPPEIVSGLLAAIAVCGGLVGLVLAVSQPVLAGSFCSLCLASSAISVVIAVGAVGEARFHWSAGRRAAPRQEVSS